MPRAKSRQIKDTDGRKNNKRLPKKLTKVDEKRSVPARRNKAKRDRTAKLIKKALDNVLGGDGEQKFWENVVEKSQDSFPDRNLIANKLDQINRDSKGATNTAPVINFYTNTDPKPEPPTIDIDHEEV